MLALGVAGCGGDDGTGPSRFAAEISIAVENVGSPAIFESTPGEPRIRCTVRFRATASGTGTATWQGATFWFFAGADRTSPVDTLVFTSSEIRDIWGSTGLDASKTAESEWWFELGAPFVVTGEFRYRPNQGAQTAAATVRVVCGPEVPPNSAGPSITELSLSSPADGLEAGDTLLVTYTTRADVGLWATAVELSGACEAFVEFSERLQTTVTRTVPLPIPRGCALGAPVIVNVYAADAALRVVSRRTYGPAVVDHTPPTINMTVFPPGGWNTPIHFAGDSVYLFVTAQDNNAVRTIVYELLPTGRRDSLAIVSNFHGPFRVPLPLDVTGPVQVRLFARDAVGLTSPEVTTPSDAVVVYPTTERPTLQTTFDGGVRDMVIDASRGAIYVVPWNRQRITVVSTATLQVARTVELPYLPISVDFSPGGDSLLVTHPGGLGVVDLRPPTAALTAVPLTLDAGLAQRPERVVVLANGKAYVALTGNSPPANKLLEVNLATGEQRIRADAANESGVAGAATIQRSPDRLAFIFNGGPGHFRRYDAISDQFTLGGSATPYSVMVSLDRGGQHNGLSLDIYDASLTFLRRVESIYGASPVGVASSVSADGEYLYYLGAPGVMRSRVSDGRLVDRTRNPIQGEMIRIASDDSFLVTAWGFETAAMSLIRLR